MPSQYLKIVPNAAEPTNNNPPPRVNFAETTESNKKVEAQKVSVEVPTVSQTPLIAPQSPPPIQTAPLEDRIEQTSTKQVITYYTTK